MIWTLWILIKSLFKKKKKKEIKRFKVGDEVSINSESYKNKEGVILDIIAPDLIDKFLYQVEIKMDDGYNHIQYLDQSEVDYTLQKKRNDKLKELGI